MTSHIAHLTTAVTIGVALFSVPVLAQHQGSSTAHLAVSATVAPHCAIHAESQEGDNGSGVRVNCGRAGLRALRVTTDRGDHVKPTVTTTGRQMAAGGEVRYTPQVPAVTLPAATADQPVTVTLDF